MSETMPRYRGGQSNERSDRAVPFNGGYVRNGILTVVGGVPTVARFDGEHKYPDEIEPNPVRDRAILLVEVIRQHYLGVPTMLDELPPESEIHWAEAPDDSELN